MFSWLLVNSIQLLLICTNSLIAPLQSSCSCTLTNKTHENPFELRCDSISVANSTSSMNVPCFRVDDLVRIGPMEVIQQTNSSTPTTRLNKTLKLVSWGFAPLLSDDSIKVLQLELNITKYAVNALSLAGAENLLAIQARSNYIHWDTCAFSNLPRLEHLLLSCKSIYGDFLTLGTGIKVVRFVDCENVQLQFHCWNCLQNPSVNVIRIRSGPPLRKYMVRFSEFQPESILNTFETGPRPINQLSIGKCIPRACPDDMLCRNNIPLQMVLAQQRQSTLITDPVTYPPIDNTTQEVFSITTNITATTLVTLKPDESAILELGHLSNTDFHSLKHKRMWIVAAILSVIIGFMLTMCVLGKLRNQHHKRKHRIKFQAGQSCTAENGCLVESPTPPNLLENQALGNPSE